MGNNVFPLLLGCLLIATGCKSVRAVRTTETIPLDFKGRIALARMQADAAERGTTAERIAAAKLGIAAANAARTDQPDRVEGHYWYAINVGLLADADRSYGINAVGEMQTALQRAIELDEKHDYAGPLRVMGLLLVRAPGPPVSIGSARKGLRLLQRAVELAPEYPENYLHLAEAFHATGKIDEARAALHKVLTAPPPTDSKPRARVGGGLRKLAWLNGSDHEGDRPWGADGVAGQRRRLRAAKLREAQHDVSQLRLALDLYLGEQGAYPVGTAAEIAKLLRGLSVGGQNPTKAAYIEAGPHEINERGELVDPWGTAYRIIIASPPRVYSCGPNKVDENGGGDDIAG